MKEWHEDCIKIKSGKTAKGKPWFEVDGYLPERDKDGKQLRTRRRFSDQDDAKEYCKKMQDKGRKFLMQGVERLTRLSETEENDAYNAINLLKAQFSDPDFTPNLVNAVQFYCQNYTPIESKTVNEAVEHYMKSRAMKDASAGHHNETKSRLDKFTIAYDGVQIRSITRDDLNNFINDRDGLSNYYYLNRYSSMAAFINHCVDQNWILASPLKSSDKPRVERKRPQILSNDEVEELLRIAEKIEDGVILPYFVLAIFCAMRPSEVARLQWEDILLDQTLENGEPNPTLLIHGKGYKDRGVDLPLICMDWLEPYRKDKGPVIPVNLRKYSDLVRIIAGYKINPMHLTVDLISKYTEEVDGCDDKGRKEWIHDVMRHTGITWRMVSTGFDYASVGYWSGNTPDVIKKHYYSVRDASNRGKMSQFYAIKPTPPKKLAKLRKG